MSWNLFWLRTQGREAAGRCVALESLYEWDSKTESGEQGWKACGRRNHCLCLLACLHSSCQVQLCCCHGCIPLLTDPGNLDFQGRWREAAPQEMSRLSVPFWDGWDLYLHGQSNFRILGLFSVRQLLVNHLDLTVQTNLIHPSLLVMLLYRAPTNMCPR